MLCGVVVRWKYCTQILHLHLDDVVGLLPAGHHAILEYGTQEMPYLGLVRC